MTLGRVVFFLIFFFGPGSSYFNANSEESVVLPEGWRLPEYKELVYPTDLWRKEGEYVRANADFDGDGLVDHAFLLVRKDGKGWGLFVFMGKVGKPDPALQLDSDNKMDQLKAMGIRVEKPGRYMTACGKGYFDCQENEPEELVLRHPAINYFKDESANSYFYWDENLKGFKRIWISD